MSLGSCVQAEGYNGRPSTDNPLGLQVKSAILIDAESGQVLYEVNADEALPPASMTKLMTEYIVLEEISNRKSYMGSNDYCNAEAASTPADGSHIYLSSRAISMRLKIYTKLWQ